MLAGAAISLGILCGCSAVPSGQLTFNYAVGLAKYIDNDSFELAVLLSNKKLSGYLSGYYKGADFDSCVGIADAYVSNTGEVSLRVRKGTSRSETRFPGRTLVPTQPPPSSGLKKLTMCIRAMNNPDKPNDLQGVYSKVSTFTTDEWPNELPPGLYDNDPVPASIRIKIIEAWLQDYKNRKLEFTTALENGSISSEDAANFLYTYRGFAKKSVQTTEELIFICLGNGKTDVANILADQLTESGANLNPQIAAELKRRKAQR